jgi:hypothetical protein
LSPRRPWTDAERARLRQMMADRLDPACAAVLLKRDPVVVAHLYSVAVR